MRVSPLLVLLFALCSLASLASETPAPGAQNRLYVVAYTGLATGPKDWIFRSGATRRVSSGDWLKPDRLYYAAGCTLGWRFHPTASLELGYCRPGNILVEGNTYSSPSGVRRVREWAKAEKFTLGFGGRFRLRDRWFLDARGGVHLSTLKMPVFSPHGDALIGLNWYWGVTPRWNVHGPYDIGIGYDRYCGLLSAHITHVSVMARF